MVTHTSPANSGGEPLNSIAFVPLRWPLDCRLSALRHQPILQGQDAVHLLGEFEVVGRDQSREAVMADEIEQYRGHFIGGLVIEITRRLVARDQ